MNRTTVQRQTPRADAAPHLIPQARHQYNPSLNQSLARRRRPRTCLGAQGFSARETIQTQLYLGQRHANALCNPRDRDTAQLAPVIAAMVCASFRSALWFHNYAASTQEHPPALPSLRRRKPNGGRPQYQEVMAWITMIIG